MRSPFPNDDITMSLLEIAAVSLDPLSTSPLQNRNSEPDMGAFLKSIAMSAKKDREYNMEEMFHRPGRAIQNGNHKENGDAEENGVL